MDWIVSSLPPNSYVEALTPNMTVFGDRAFKEVIKVKWGHKGGAQTLQDWCPYKKRKREQSSVSQCVHRRKAMWGRSEVVVYKPRRQVSPETNPAGILILYSQTSELWENKFLLFNPPSLWYFVIAAWAD